MATRPIPSLTVEQYLEYDRNSEIHNEYVFGEIVPMTGAMPAHSLIAANTLIAIGKRIQAGPRRVYDASLRVCLDRKRAYAHPDVTVVCGALEFTDDRRDTITNPKLVVEVLSPATSNYDLGRKARMYFEIPSMAELLRVEQDAIWIEHWARQPDGRWEFEKTQDPNATIRIQSAGCELPIAEVYAGVELVVQD